MGVPCHLSSSVAYVPEAHVSLPSKYASCLVANDSVIACSSGKRIHLLSRETLALTGELKGHKVNVEEVCFFQNGPKLASCGADCTAKVWDVRQQKCATTYTLDGEPTSIAVGQNDSLIAVAVEEKIDLWDVRMGKKSFVFTQVHTDIVNCLRFHPLKPSLLISAGDDNLVCQLDTTMLDEEDGVPWVVNNEENVRAVRVIGDSQCHALVSASTTEVIRIWGEKCENLGEFYDIRNSPLLQVEESCGYVVDVLLQDERAYVLGGSSEGALALYHLNLQGLHLAYPFATDGTEGHLGVVRCVLPLGPTALLAGDENGKLIAWRLS